MRLFITILICLAIAVGLGMLAVEDPGYVVLSREPYVIRLPLLLLAGILFLVFVLLYLLFNFIAGVFRAPGNYRKWRKRRMENSVQQYTMRGYTGLIEGDWSKAESSLLKRLEHNKTPLLNYLGAAYAAQQQGRMDRRNRYLDSALSNHPANALAINLTRARLLYRAGETAAARDCLERLRKTNPGNIPAARLLADVYKDLGDWDALTRLAPHLKKIRAFREDELKSREQYAFDQLISSPAFLQGGAERLGMTWKSLPSDKKKDPDMVASYVKQLIRADKIKEAEKELRIALNRGFDPKLINLYGRVNSPFMEYQIQLAESFSKKHGDHPELLLALARLYRFNNDYAAAKDFYKKAIGSGAQEEAYTDLAALLEQMGETDAALFFFKKGAERLLPSPETDGGEAGGKAVLIDDHGQTDVDRLAGGAMPVVR